MSQNLLNGINRRTLKSNPQRIAFKLIQAAGEWVSSRQLAKNITGVVRARELRRERYGAFDVECASAQELGKVGDAFYYRIKPSSVTRKRLEQVFKITK